MFDVAIIGRGMIGSAAARHLAESGLSVAVVGPDEPSDWSSWTGPFASHFDEGRITRVSDRHPAWSLAARRSIERYGDIEARSGIVFHHPVGLVISTPDLNTWLATSQANGAAVEAVDAEWVAETTGIAVPDGAPVAYETAPAGFVNPRALVAAQNVLARRAGASIVAEAARSIEHRSGGQGLVIAGPWGSVDARRVIIATGSFGHGLLTAEDEFRLGLVRRPRTVILAELGQDTDGETRAVPSLIMRDQTDDRLASIYWVPPVAYPDGRTYLKIGGVLAVDQEIAAGPDPHGELVDWFHGSGDPNEADALRSALAARLPGRPILSSATVPCVYTGTASGLPIIDWLDDGLAVAVGGNGAAAKSSDELGRLAAALAAGDLAPDLGDLPEPEVFGLVR